MSEFACVSLYVFVCACENAQLCHVGLSAEWPKPQTHRIGT